MPSICFSSLRLPVVRVTAENACGLPLTGAGTTLTTSGLISVAMAVNQQDRQDYFTLNADAQPCVTNTAPPILKWIDLTITFCNVDPTLLSVITGEPLVLNDAASPVAIGWDTSVGSVNTVNFGFEGWTRIGGTTQACAANGQVQYGYFLLPWVTEGVVGDVTFQNGLANFTVTARTQAGGTWGVGPYTVVASSAVATLNLPLPLLTAIGPNVHRRMFVTTLAPPLPLCGGASLPAGPLVATVTTPPKTVTLTFPVPSILPATVNWGDGTAPQNITSGLTTTHVYTTAATFTITMAPNAISAPFWSGTVTTS